MQKKLKINHKKEAGSEEKTSLSASKKRNYIILP